MFYLVWVPIVIAFYALYYIISHYNNVYGGKWFWILIFMALFPGWAIVTRYTKNILWDGMMYDLILYLMLPITMIFLGETVQFKLHQWVGLVMAVIGFILMRI